jgi:hypothetical protein
MSKFISVEYNVLNFYIIKSILNVLLSYMQFNGCNFRNMLYITYASR